MKKLNDYFTIKNNMEGLYDFYIGENLIDYQLDILDVSKYVMSIGLTLGLSKEQIDNFINDFIERH